MCTGKSVYIHDEFIRKMFIRCIVLCHWQCEWYVCVRLALIERFAVDAGSAAETIHFLFVSQYYGNMNRRTKLHAKNHFHNFVQLRSS